MFGPFFEFTGMPQTIISEQILNSDHYWGGGGGGLGGLKNTYVSFFHDVLRRSFFKKLGKYELTQHNQREIS